MACKGQVVNFKGLLMPSVAHAVGLSCLTIFLKQCRGTTRWATSSQGDSKASNLHNTPYTRNPKPETLSHDPRIPHIYMYIHMYRYKDIHIYVYVQHLHPHAVSRHDALGDLKSGRPTSFDQDVFVKEVREPYRRVWLGRNFELNVTKFA